MDPQGLGSFTQSRETSLEDSSLSMRRRTRTRHIFRKKTKSTVQVCLATIGGPFCCLSTWFTWILYLRVSIQIFWNNRWLSSPTRFDLGGVKIGNLSSWSSPLFAPRFFELPLMPCRRMGDHSKPRNLVIELKHQTKKPSPTKIPLPGDSKCLFHPLVGGHLNPWKGHLTIPGSLNHPNKVTWNHQVYIYFLFRLAGL